MNEIKQFDNEIEEYINKIKFRWIYYILNKIEMKEILDFIKFYPGLERLIINQLSNYWHGYKPIFLSFAIPRCIYSIKNPKYWNDGGYNPWFKTNRYLNIDNYNYRWSNNKVPYYAWGIYGCRTGIEPESLLIVKVPDFPLLNIETKYYHKMTPAYL